MFVVSLVRQDLWLLRLQSAAQRQQTSHKGHWRHANLQQPGWRCPSTAVLRWQRFLVLSFTRAHSAAPQGRALTTGSCSNCSFVKACTWSAALIVGMRMGADEARIGLLLLRRLLGPADPRQQHSKRDNRSRMALQTHENEGKGL